MWLCVLWWGYFLLFYQQWVSLNKFIEVGNNYLMSIEAITTEAPEPVFNLYTTGPHNFIAEGVLAHNFTELRWLRTWAHRLVMDPFHSGVVEGVEA